jgi:tetratricopeptide (TPR) repeat protein|tara:strand:+ start:1197 stop:1586 length:390 start_codon:yes stop_codon:yes gene_type:complete
MRFRAEQFYSRADIRRAIINNPFEYRYHFMMGNAFTHLRQYKAAKAHYRIVLALRPNYFDAASNLALVQAKSGKLDEAQGIYEAVLRMWPKHEEAQAGLTLVAKLQEAKNEQFRLLLEQKTLDEAEAID